MVGGSADEQVSPRRVDQRNPGTQRPNGFGGGAIDVHLVGSVRRRGQLRYGKPDVLLTLMGLLGALVSITAGAGAVAPHWAVLIGAVGGLLVPLASVYIDLIIRIDDPAGGVAVHAVGGAWGVLAVGMLAPGSLVERLRHLGVQALGLLVITGLAATCSFGLFEALRRTVGLRSKEADEFDGLDLAEHDIGAYPDFQQNSIRSYHLREA